ncbi:hypothetical protein KW855_000787 [Salmonella enterica]|uniref:Gp11 C-terminal domain-containing protein n=2 Tax=Salmonella enterica TaxID=28901 RepID=A0A735MZ29_SALET|nr:hypothetical protein [Salmonella enterica]EBD0357549.1 hypothetical protein [Salmonella enterica subsp. enterica]EBM0753009.1 hypothetical protein [Salmonella enterica subsp. enterica serovar Give]EBW1554193.1 hypothetical protein [Salmonella enterica subsp. enterica serovar Hartford]ECG1399926.1 hypothetical protein [Salmonella enterica subsp. enterica serovar Panama str. CFSAN000601]ECS3870000.1 hypothetical protein [Salmonella enterica subsp. enterica serovar Litchfield]ECV4834877.1 hyp
MIDAKVLEGVKALIKVYGRLTCGVLAEKLQMPPSSMVYFLRDAVDAGVLTECNGFYDIPRPRQSSRKSHQEPEPVTWCDFRKSLPWIEGNGIPSLVKDFAMGVLTCETTYIVAEVDEEARNKGVPHFTFAYIDVRLGRFIDGMSGWEITRSVLRYLIIDRSPVPEFIPVSVEVV